MAERCGRAESYGRGRERCGKAHMTERCGRGREGCGKARSREVWEGERELWESA